MASLSWQFELNANDPKKQPESTALWRSYGKKVLQVMGEAVKRRYPIASTRQLNRLRKDTACFGTPFNHVTVAINNGTTIHVDVSAAPPPLRPAPVHSPPLFLPSPPLLPTTHALCTAGRKSAAGRRG